MASIRVPAMKTPSTNQPVRRELVGENAPSVKPGKQPGLFGSVTLTPIEPVEVRSFQTFKVVYTVGRLGIDDTGSIRIAFRIISDAGSPQKNNPAAPNYVTASSNGQGRLQLSAGPHGQRPWNTTLTVRQRGGYLSEGEQITIIFGDTHQGSPGMLMQTFAEEAYEFRAFVDAQATGHFVPLGEQLSIPIVAGPVHHWKAVLPTLRRPGEPFHFGLKAEDIWHNPTSQARGQVRLKTSLPVAGLPLEFDYEPADRAMTFDNLSVSGEGVLWIEVLIDGKPLAEAGPLVIQKCEAVGFWGDLHGQTGETVGTNSIESYFDYGRNKAFLDVCAHQGNDYQINGRFWRHLNSLTAELDEPDRFVVFPGYEWSGSTAVGGDHNVYFRNEGGTIHRCSHALIEDISDLDTDANTLSELYKALEDEDCVLYAHVGGRYANIHYDHNPRLETAVELHSAWGTFEWILTDGFKLGRRVGVVCNSDGHKGRPGATHPGSSSFGAYGGLTCFLTEKLDRDSIFEAMRRRHHYGTTGCRMHIDLTAGLPAGGVVYERNPDAQPDTPCYEVSRAMMGDIVQTASATVEVNCTLIAHAGIERVELRNGEKVIETIRPFKANDLGDRIRVLWSGAEYRGRGRTTTWRGRAKIAGMTIQRFATINAWNPERLFEQRGSNTIVWDSVTTGNFLGFDVWLKDGCDGRLSIATNHGELDVDLAEVGLSDTILDAGGLARRLRAFRLPNDQLEREMRFSRTIPLEGEGDNPIWICVTTEDGHQAWTSPIYLFKD